SVITFNAAGGLVGRNDGLISGPTLPLTIQLCGAGFTCASGAVSVGSVGTGGGLAGINTGTIDSAFATGAVTGAARRRGSESFGPVTILGGLGGLNFGTISHTFATGSVGTAGVANLAAGGLVGDNFGTVLRSHATGAVSAGDFSQAGG